jgi:hypothetical protein
VVINLCVGIAGIGVPLPILNWTNPVHPINNNPNMIKNNAMIRLNNSGSNFGRFNFVSINKEHKTIIKGIRTTNTNPHIKNQSNF